MASVYRGYDLTLGRSVAIKILRRDLADDTAFRTRFRLEAQAASRMANPTIVRVFDAGEDAITDASGTHPAPYIVMELVHGALLKDIIASGPVPVSHAVRYTDGILEALEYSHRAGVVHRDIKPGNVIVTDSGQVKVMDFGIARAVSDSSSTVAETTSIIGTAAYFSPEQAKGESVDARADLYSTGVVLYELLTGRTPFRGDSAVAVAYQHVSETPVAPSAVVETVPRALDAVVLRALAKDPFQRFQDAASFREAVDAAVDGKAPSKRRLNSLTSDLYGPDPRAAAETAQSLRQLTTDTTMARTQSGPPVAWVWAGFAVLAVLLISVLFWAITIRPTSEVPETAHVVPDVSGMTYEKANETLDAQDLIASRVDEASPDVAAGNVIRSDPDAGTSVDVGQEVTLYVSRGAETAVVPALAGLLEQPARDAIAGAGLIIGTITQRNDPALAAGTVISSDPEAGAEVGLQTPVNLVLATGRVVILDYRGFTVDAATRALEAEDSQLFVETLADPACPASEGSDLVVAQSIPPGEAPVHATVTLTYCSGS
jgi:serine/threonine-protein kinase